MCGVIGFIGNRAARKIHHGLSFLQHRGQDATGITTLLGKQLRFEKGFGVAEHFFDDVRLAALEGDMGLGHVRYSTAGSAHVLSEVQPFYVNQPYGMALVHNGNLVNQSELRQWAHAVAHRHINSDSDSDLLINVLAHAIAERLREDRLTPKLLFDAVSDIHKLCQGSYAAVVLIAGYGLLAFRDPHGIRPLVYGGNGNGEWLVASENAAFRPLGFDRHLDIPPGGAIFVDFQKNLHQSPPTPPTAQLPCIFEYIYLARPDSTLDGISVYKARMNMGRKLAEKIRKEHADLTIDCVVPVPDSGRVAAMELAQHLNVPYREGLVKNRHTGRTFITAGQSARSLSVSKKLNVIESEFTGKAVLLVDDSIVRGTTGRQLVALARAAGADKVYFASAAPPVRFPNIYGIDIPTHAELLAGYRDKREISDYLDVDRVIYQSLEDLKEAVRAENPKIKDFETSCFDGNYRVGKVDTAYFKRLEVKRKSEPLPPQGELVLGRQQ